MNFTSKRKKGGAGLGATATFYLHHPKCILTGCAAWPELLPKQPHGPVRRLHRPPALLLGLSRFLFSRGQSLSSLVLRHHEREERVGRRVRTLGSCPGPTKGPQGGLGLLSSLGCCEISASCAEWWLSRSFLGVLGHLCRGAQQPACPLDCEPSAQWGFWWSAQNTTVRCPGWCQCLKAAPALPALWMCRKHSVWGCF